MTTDKPWTLTEALRAGATEPCDGCCFGEHMTKAADELDRLQSALATARREALEALKPFADWADAFYEGTPPESKIINYRSVVNPHAFCIVTLGDIRHAHEVYRALISQSVEVGPTSSENGGVDG